MKKVYKKSKKGGIHDQMNALASFMIGYTQQELDKVDTTTKDEGYVTSDHSREMASIYGCRIGNIQWQIGTIEFFLEKWGLELVEAFQLGKFLYETCPSFHEDTKAAHIRLRSFGNRVRVAGKKPMDAPEMVELDILDRKIEEVKALSKKLGIDPASLL